MNATDGPSMNVVHQEIVFGDAVFADLNNFRMSPIHSDSHVSILAKDHRLTMFEIEHAIGSHCALGKVIECVVVEDVAVLVDLDKRDAFVFAAASTIGRDV
jgi:hypothetical protein